MYHELWATPETCRWGSFDNAAPSVLTVASGDIVRVECLSHRAGDIPDLMMDDGVRRVYEAFSLDARGPGGHIVTGPVVVRGAEPGDALEVRLLAADARLPYGSNLHARWGLLYNPDRPDNPLQGHEHVTAYRIVGDGVAVAQFQYVYPEGQMSRKGAWIAPESVFRQPVSALRVRLRPHMGISGLASADPGPISTIPPGKFGGNVDNRSFVPGTAMFYPVQVSGGWWWAGDTHFAEGDGEISGTAIEGHLNVVVQLLVHKGMPLPSPVLETADGWMVHGFGGTLDEAMADAAINAIRFMDHRWHIPPRDAYSWLSAAGDFRVTQVVNGTKGAHVLIPKSAPV
ncbi:MAG: acetamidase/formamidase family protein [Thermaerobacter sp.]|nr:acetamidase/formamidase family protein [Thermaerobacter sp.]